MVRIEVYIYIYTYIIVVSYVCYAKKKQNFPIISFLILKVWFVTFYGG